MLHLIPNEPPESLPDELYDELEDQDISDEDLYASFDLALNTPGITVEEIDLLRKIEDHYRRDI